MANSVRWLDGVQLRRVPEFKKAGPGGQCEPCSLAISQQRKPHPYVYHGGWSARFTGRRNGSHYFLFFIFFVHRIYDSFIWALQWSRRRPGCALDTLCKFFGPCDSERGTRALAKKASGSFSRDILHHFRRIYFNPEMATLNLEALASSNATFVAMRQPRAGELSSAGLHH